MNKKGPCAGACANLARTLRGLGPVRANRIICNIHRPGPIDPRAPWPGPIHQDLRQIDPGPERIVRRLTASIRSSQSGAVKVARGSLRGSVCTTTKNLARELARTLREPCAESLKLMFRHPLRHRLREPCANLAPPAPCDTLPKSRPVS